MTSSSLSSVPSLQSNTLKSSRSTSSNTKPTTRWMSTRNKPTSTKWSKPSKRKNNQLLTLRNSSPKTSVACKDSLTKARGMLSSVKVGKFLRFTTKRRRRRRRLRPMLRIHTTDSTFWNSSEPLDMFNMREVEKELRSGKENSGLIWKDKSLRSGQQTSINSCSTSHNLRIRSRPRSKKENSLQSHMSSHSIRVLTSLTVKQLFWLTTHLFTRFLSSLPSNYSWEARKIQMRSINSWLKSKDSPYTPFRWNSKAVVTNLAAPTSATNM